MNRRLGIYIGISVSMIAAWVFFQYLPMSKTHEKAEAEILSSQQRIADISNTLSELPKLVAACTDLERARLNLDQTLYTKQDVLELFSHLQNSASDFNLMVIEITPPVEELLRLNREVADTTKPLFLNIGLRLEGSYTDFALFTKEVESSSYFRGINQCRIFGSKDPIKRLGLSIGFKALLGGVGAKS